MAELGRLTAVFDADTRKFDAGARGVAAKVNGLTTSLGSLTGGVGSATGALSGLTSPMGLAAGGAIILASAIGGLATGLFALIKSSAAAGGELFDLSQKTGFTVETLSTLSIVAKTTGSDIKGLTGSLVIFQKNMEAAHDRTSRQGQLFKSLNIDINDNEKATRQAFTALFKMGEGARQTATAMQLYGRSGKDVLAIIKETNGNLDEATKKYDKMGLTISTSAATASDKFNDVLEETTLQLSAVTRSIGMELLPTATNALQQISYWLAENKGQWSSWGTTIADVLRGVSGIAQSEIGAIIGWIGRLSAEISGLPSLVRGLAGFGASNRPVEDAYGPGGAMRGGRASLPGTPEYLAAERRRAALAASMSRPGGGGGGRGGGGSAKQDPGVQLLRQLEEQFRSLTPRTEAQIVAQKFLEKEFAKTTDTLKKKILITAMDIDSQKKILELTRERYATEASLARLADEEMIKSIVRTARRIADIQRERFATKAGRERPAWIDLGGGSTVGGPVGESTRARIATVDEQVAREQIAKIREQMQGLAGDLTSIFARSIGDGFNQGVKSGLQTLAQGLLQIVQDVFLKRLAEGLSELLGGLATGGGGSWWKTLLGIVGPAVAGGVGGGIGGGKGGLVPGTAGKNFAIGGFLKPGEWGMAGERGPEPIYGGHTGMTVIPNNKTAQPVVHNHYVINLPPAPNTSYNPRRSARQQADMILAALHGSQA